MGPLRNPKVSVSVCVHDVSSVCVLLSSLVPYFVKRPA